MNNAERQARLPPSSPGLTPKISTQPPPGLTPRLPPTPEQHEERHRVTVHAALPRFSGTSCMSSKDIFFVVRAQMRPLELADSYAQDYYFNKFWERTMKRQGALPVTEKDKAELKAREAHIKRDQQSITSKWEEGHRVLGHVQKSDISRPRALLQTPTELVAVNAPFTSQMWRARRVVDAGVQQLLCLEETRSLITSNPASLEPAKSVEREHLDALSSVISGAPPHPSDIAAEPPPWHVDQIRSGSIEALLTLPKGVKLLVRFVEILPATAASSLIVKAALQYLTGSSELDLKLASALESYVLPHAPLQNLIPDAKANFGRLADLVLKAGDARTPLNTARHDLYQWHDKRHLLQAAL